MLNLKNSTTGIDTPVQALQTYLYNQLKVLWPVDDTNFEGYGRVYRNKNDIGYVPELFVNSNGENNTQYKAVYFDKTTQKALFFFDAEDRQVVVGMTTTVNVYLIFIANIALLKPALAHRADEEVRNDVRKFCSQKKFNAELVGEETGMRNVFSTFDGIRKSDTDVFEDRHPLHCFKMNLKFLYNPSKNC